MNTQHKKLLVLAFLLVTGLGGLGFRLYDLQVLRHEEFRALAENNTQRTIIREPLRGQILDIRGNPLATSIPVKVVCADPTLIGDKQAIVAHALAPILEMKESYLIGRLTPRVRSDGRTNRYVVLKRKVSLDDWATIRGVMTNLTFGVDESKLKSKEANFYKYLRRSAIFSEEDQLRVYYNKNLASHVIGYVGFISRTNSTKVASFAIPPKGTNFIPDDAIVGKNGVISNQAERVEIETGLNGIELMFNKQLTGAKGWRRTELDGHKRELFSFRDQDVQAHNGANVILTIDVGLQDIVETELAEGLRKNTPLSISCMVVRPKTGEILAMASLPNFDPNSPGKSPVECLKNRIICNIAEPGSTFKIVPVSAALNEHLVTLNDMFDCENGAFFYGGKTLHDHEHYRALSVLDIIRKSSNIGAAKIGIRLGANTLYDYIRRFGFGRKTGIDLPGEVSGIVHPVMKWSGVSLAQIPMGQGIAASPLQIMMAMCTIANKGVLMRPMLVDRLVDQDGKTVLVKYSPQPVRRVISEEAAYKMVQALKTVPTKEGTAEAAHMDNFTVAGKTGTAQKNANGVYLKKYFASFIGFLPADNPEICISVMLDEPRTNGYYGGKVAGPVFKAIADRAVNYLNLKPDIQPELEPESTNSNSTLATIPGIPVARPNRKE